MKIAERQIGGTTPPYIIAEISGNHCGSLDNAKRLIRAAKRAGADAVKTQCYEPDTITLDCNKLDFIVQDGLWKGRTLYELYGKAYTPFAWHKELYKVARDEGITIFSSVFDKSSVDLLEGLGCPAYKIASFEVGDTPLIEYATSTGKPLIISTGLASDREVLEANEASKFSAAFLHCTSEYPGTIEHADLGRIAKLDKLLGFRQPIGISDHTPGAVHIPVAATALRAAIIEKHLKLDSEKSEDDEFSINGVLFQTMVMSVHATHEAMKERPRAESNRQLKRSLYVVEDVKEGEEFTAENIRSIRPGYGMPPKSFGKMLGRKARKPYRRGDPLTL